MKMKITVFAAALMILSLGMFGCASKGYLNHKIELLEDRDKELENEIHTLRDEANENIGEIKDDIHATQEDILYLKDEAKEEKTKLETKIASIEESLKRAEAASKLSLGKLLFEVTISDESIPFGFDKSALSKDARSALDTFASTLIAKNRNVFIEIQGHTDNTGSKKYNLELGQARADSAMRYLYTKHGIPLIRMNAFSYGEAEPVADNKTAKNRAKNRRVVLLVME